MNSLITSIEIPKNSAIAEQLAGADFFDCYQIPMQTSSSERKEASAMELYLNIVAKTPSWVNRLMALRNKIVGYIGLKNLGALAPLENEIRSGKPARDYRVGDKVGIFSLLYSSENEVILGDTDKHLDVKISLSKQTRGEEKFLAMSTIVHIHNNLGRVYMFFVGPAHKIIAPAVLSRYLPY